MYSKHLNDFGFDSIETEFVSTVHHPPEALRIFEDETSEVSTQISEKYKTSTDRTNIR